VNNHSFWICYIIESALCIGAISSLLLPVPHDHFQTRSHIAICIRTHFKSPWNISSHCRTNVLAFSYTICTSWFSE